MSSDALASASSRPALTLAQRRLMLRTTIVVLSGLLLLGAMVVALGKGSHDIPAGDVIKALRSADDVKKSTYIIVHEVRLPRALTGAVVGLNLAIAGVLLQGVVRSPLGDPYILGVSAGGGLVAAGVTLLDWGPEGLPLPLAAFAGSLVGASIVYAVAWDGTGVTTTRLALAGVAVTTMIGAFTTTIVVMSVEGGGQIFFQWLVGGLYTAGWHEYNLAGPYALIGFVLAMMLASRANVLALGDDVAQSLGLNVERTRFMLSAVAALLAGSAVAVAGLIGFVGLLVPFVARRLVGSDFRFLIPVSGILGAALLVWADWSAREVFPPLLIDADTNIEFPVGIITAVIGGPLFLWLIRARRAQW